MSAREGREGKEWLSECSTNGSGFHEPAEEDLCVESVERWSLGGEGKGNEGELTWESGGISLGKSGLNRSSNNSSPGVGGGGEAVSVSSSSFGLDSALGVVESVLELVVEPVATADEDEDFLVTLFFSFARL